MANQPITGLVLVFIGFGFYFGFATGIFVSICSTFLTVIPYLGSLFALGCSASVGSFVSAIPSYIFLLIGLIGVYELVKK